MKNLHGLLHGRLKTMFRGLLEFESGLPPTSSLWMRINDPHNHMIMVIGLCVKRALMHKSSLFARVFEN